MREGTKPDRCPECGGTNVKVITDRWRSCKTVGCYHIWRLKKKPIPLNRDETKLK